MTITKEERDDIKWSCDKNGSRYRMLEALEAAEAELRASEVARADLRADVREAQKQAQAAEARADRAEAAIEEAERQARRARGDAERAEVERDDVCRRWECFKDEMKVVMRDNATMKTTCAAMNATLAVLLETKERTATDAGRDYVPRAELGKLPEVQQMVRTIDAFRDARDRAHAQAAAMREALEGLVDGGPCDHLDHHGVCQTHSMGDTPCANAEALKALASPDDAGRALLERLATAEEGRRRAETAYGQVAEALRATQDERDAMKEQVEVLCTIVTERDALKEKLARLEKLHANQAEYIQAHRDGGNIDDFVHTKLVEDVDALRAENERLKAAAAEWEHAAEVLRPASDVALRAAAEKAVADLKATTDSSVGYRAFNALKRTIADLEKALKGGGA